MNCRRLAGSFSSSARVRSGAAMAPRERDPSHTTYFQRTHWAWMAAIIVGLTYYGWVVFSPETMPHDYLGPLGTFTKYLVENHKLYLDVGYAATWAVHVLEAIYAVKLCWDKGITDLSTQFWWGVQTFLFGFASIMHLLLYEPPKDKRE
ncbi:transmembrane protein 254 [Eublepharis macularius]|uniref:Transmembrane protein 254 n=1 Tax=Eublepharis macularius TaxID=481883 RepID=A0AA97L4N0_EUBMA|nr:transmembrane protein 254 [Eublepharis macularius]